MVDASRPKETAGGSPIVLCCAHGESARLEGLVAVLRDRGGTVELLEGAELEPRVLATVIDRYRGGGLYVLCRGGAFDREKIDAVREVLLAHRIPFGRTLTLPALDPSELLERIEQSLRRMVAHAPVALDQPKPSRTESPAQASARQRRPTVMVTPPAQAAAPATPPRNPTPIPAPPPPRAASERPAPPKPPPARQSPPPPNRVVRASERATVELPAQESIVPASSTPTQPARERSEAEIASAETRADSRPDALMPRLDTAAGAIEIDEEHLVEDPSIQPIPPVSFDDDVEIDTKVDLTGVLAGIGDNTAVAPAPEPVRGGTQVAEAIPFEGYREDDVEIADVTQVAPAPTVVTSVTTATTVRSPTVQRTVVAAAVEEAPSRLRFGVAAVVGSLAIGILAAVIVSSGDDDAETTAAANKTPDKKPDAKPIDTKAEDTKAEDSKAEDSKAEDTKAEDTKAEDTKAEDTKAEDAKAEDTVPEDTKLAVVTPKPTPTEPVAKAPPARPRPVRKVEVVPPPKTRVQKALRERSIRALDVLLVTRRAAGPMDQKAAVAHCDGLELAGLDEWRLPEIGELASLTDAGFLGRGFFWSATAADTFGDSRMAWNGARREANWRGKTSAVVCVRGRGGT